MFPSFFLLKNKAQCMWQIMISKLIRQSADIRAISPPSAFSLALFPHCNSRGTRLPPPCFPHFCKQGGRESPGYPLIRYCTICLSMFIKAIQMNLKHLRFCSFRAQCIFSNYAWVRSLFIQNQTREQCKSSRRYHWRWRSMQFPYYFAAQPPKIQKRIDNSVPEVRELQMRLCWREQKCWTLASPL